MLWLGMTNGKRINEKKLTSGGARMGENWLQAGQRGKKGGSCRSGKTVTVKKRKKHCTSGRYTSTEKNGG